MTAEILAALKEIEKAAGTYAVSESNPGGLAAYYDASLPLPWRISDDWESESFATSGEAIVAAAEWADDMGAD